MWTFLATDAMGFGGLLLAYGVLRVRAGVDTWPDPRARLALAPAAAMTFALLASSLTMTLATRAHGGAGAAAAGCLRRWRSASHSWRARRSSTATCWAARRRWG